MPCRGKRWHDAEWVGRSEKRVAWRDIDRNTPLQNTCTSDGYHLLVLHYVALRTEEIHLVDETIEGPADALWILDQNGVYRMRSLYRNSHASIATYSPSMQKIRKIHR